MKKAIWQGITIAQSDKTIQIEGNEYFPPESIDRKYFDPSDTHSICPWKGEASYYNVRVNDQINADAAWYYPQPMKDAIETVGNDFTNYVGFWRGVEVVDA